MTPDQIIGVLQNDGINLRASKGRIVLTPKRAVADRHRALVASRKAEVLALLERYPGGTAAARIVLDDNGRLSPAGFVPRADEMGRPARHRPQVVMGRRRR
jgi:hypothetical protein